MCPNEQFLVSTCIHSDLSFTKYSMPLTFYNTLTVNKEIFYEVKLSYSSQDSLEVMWIIIVNRKSLSHLYKCLLYQCSIITFPENRVNN